MDLRKLTPANRIQSFGYAVRGLCYVMRTQPNAWIMALAVLVVTAAGCACHVSPAEWALLAMAMLLVLIAETINTAIESLTDLVSPDRNPLAGRAKDVAAGAVLLAVLFALIVAAIVFAPRFAGIVRHLL